MEKMDIFDIRKGRGGGVGFFLRLQTDGIDSNRRKPYLIDNIPRRTWLIIVCTQKKGCAKSFGTRVEAPNGRRTEDEGSILNNFLVPGYLVGTRQPIHHYK